MRHAGFARAYSAAMAWHVPLRPAETAARESDCQHAEGRVVRGSQSAEQHAERGLSWESCPRTSQRRGEEWQASRRHFSVESVGKRSDPDEAPAPAHAPTTIYHPCRVDDSAHRFPSELIWPRALQTSPSWQVIKLDFGVRPDEASSIQEVQFLRRQGPASQRQSSLASCEASSMAKRKQSDRQAATRVK